MSMGRRILWSIAFLVLGGALLFAAGWGLKPGWRGYLYDGLLSGLRRWDALHLDLDPHLDHSRPSARKDPRPLSAQAAAMEKDLDEVFTVEGGRLFLISEPPVPVGDVCLWQGVFAAEAALRWHLRPSPGNLRRAARALEGLEILMTHGRPLSRAVYPASLETEPPGRWYHRDERWQWKEDASLDSASGWIFGAVLVRELVGPLRAPADAALLKFARGLKEAGYRLRNSDGSLTRYNTAGGAVLNSPVGVLVTMAALSAAARAEPSGPWREEHARFVAQGMDRWGAYTSGPVLWLNKSTNHNIAFLALAAALLTDEAPERKAVYAKGLVRLSRVTGRMGVSFWIYLSHWALFRAGMGDPRGDGDVAAFVVAREEHLRAARVAMLEWDYPYCKTMRETRNSLRRDIKTRSWPFFGVRAPLEPLPVWQRPPADFVWQRSAYALDDWEGYRRVPPQRFSPLDFLVAYRLGIALSAPLEQAPAARQRERR